jgi:hypothetical protein
VDFLNQAATLSQALDDQVGGACETSVALCADAATIFAELGR